MGFTEAIKSCFSKFATFSGRASRSEYWYWVLFNVLVNVVIIILVVASMDPTLLFAAGPIMIILQILFFIPTLAVTVRRLHDTGKSTVTCILLYLLSFLIIPAIILFIYTIEDSQPGDNEFGPNPNSVEQSRRNNNNYNYSQRPQQQQPRTQAYQQPNRNTYQQQRQTQTTNDEETVIASASSYRGTACLVFGGRRYPLTMGSNIVGRKAETSHATLQIPADDLYMSREHCIININTDGSATISNYKNKNRTAVNGKILVGQHKEILTNGCQITLGHTNFEYRA